MYKYILFDLDGTLTDPGLGITNAVMHALKKFNIEAPDRSELYKFIGPPLKDSFMKYYGFCETEADRAIAFYREYLRRMLEIIPDLIEQLRSEDTESAPDILKFSSEIIRFASDKFIVFLFETLLFPLLNTSLVFPFPLIEYFLVESFHGISEAALEAESFTEYPFLKK